MSGTRRRLLLLRHAKALPAAPGSPDEWDHARPLAERGMIEAAALGVLLRQRGLQPQHALVSTATRARQTFTQLHLELPAAAASVLYSDQIYLADPASLLEALRDTPAETASVLLVGHNPGLHALAYRLSGEASALQRGFSTCMLALFDIDATWPELQARHASLVDVLAP